jgi:hypothetical protein
MRTAPTRECNVAPDGNVACCDAENVTWLEKARVWKCYMGHKQPTVTLKTETTFGEVEADESFFGGKVKNMDAMKKIRKYISGEIRRGGYACKAIVMGLMETDGNQDGNQGLRPWFLPVWSQEAFRGDRHRTRRFPRRQKIRSQKPGVRPISMHAGSALGAQRPLPSND